VLVHLVVCYDVVEDKRRDRLRKHLRGYLRHVQKSVFEGPLHARRYAALLDGILSRIDHGVDTVRVYRLCRGCRVGTDLLGTSAPVPSGPEDVVV